MQTLWMFSPFVADPFCAHFQVAPREIRKLLSVGAVYQQLVLGSWAPLAFFPRSSHTPSHGTPPLRHFCFLLAGKDFTLFIDHKPLTQALFRVFRPGRPGSRGSCLSSLSLPATLSTSLAPKSRESVDFSEFSALQPSCPKTSSLHSNPSLHIVSVPSEPPPYSATSLLVLCVLWFQFSSGTEFLRLSTTSHTHVFDLPGGWS